MHGRCRCIGMPPALSCDRTIRRYRRMGFKYTQNVYRMRIYFAIIAVVWFDILADLIRIWPDLDCVIVERVAWYDHRYGVKSKFIDVRQGVWRLSILV